MFREEDQMESDREYQLVRFGRQLDIPKLRAALARMTRDLMKNPSADTPPVRPESIQIQRNQTLVYLSGTQPGLNAVSRALQHGFSGVKVAKASREDATRLQPVEQPLATPKARKPRRG
jgi:hypothetical protein